MHTRSIFYIACCVVVLMQHNEGVIVYIPAEDLITSGMYDISKKWILLDEYRQVSSEKPEVVEGEELPPSIVTHWQPSPKPPKEE